MERTYRINYEGTIFWIRLDFKKCLSNCKNVFQCFVETALEQHFTYDFAVELWHRAKKRVYHDLERYFDYFIDCAIQGGLSYSEAVDLWESIKKPSLSGLDTIRSQN